MTVRTLPAGGPLALTEAQAALLRERLAAAIKAARRHGGPVLAALTVRVDPALDVSAAVLAARRAEDRFFCFEQPDREGFALAGLGQAVAVEAEGPGRFTEVAARVRELGREPSSAISRRTRAGRWARARSSSGDLRSRTTGARRPSGRRSLRHHWSCPRPRSPATAARPGSLSARRCSPTTIPRPSRPASPGGRPSCDRRPCR